MTFILLLQPSVKPLVYTQSKEFRISSDQLCTAFVQASNYFNLADSAVYTHSLSRCLPMVELSECINSAKLFLRIYAYSRSEDIPRITLKRSFSSGDSFAGFLFNRNRDRLKYFLHSTESVF